MKKKLVNSIISCFIILCLISCNEKIEKKGKKFIRPVKAITIQTGTNSDLKSIFSGTARGINESILSFRVPGVLETLKSNVGDKVKAKQIVASLDDRDFFLRLDEVTNKLKIAQAQFEQLQKGVRSEDLRIIDQKIKALSSTQKTAKTEYNRVQKLYAADAASKSQLDSIKTRLDQVQSELKSAEEERLKAVTGGREEEIRAARANIRSIRSSISQAKAALNDTKLRIPFDGLISYKHISNFQQIGVGHPIYTLVDIERIEIQISIPERLITGINSGQKVEVEFLNFPEKFYPGKITKVGVVADRQTLTYPVFIEVLNHDRSILPGMSSNVIIKTPKDSKPFPVIPIHAILEDKISKARYVWVFDVKTNTVKRRNIILGRILNDAIEVLKGLQNGEKVIVAGVHRVKEGMKVKVTGN